MTRTTLATALMVLGISATALAQDYSWVETRFHRVHLRNGNFIDGNVTGLTERDVFLKLRVGEMNIRRDSIDRIELMKMRSLLEKPKLDPPLKKSEPKPTVKGASGKLHSSAEAIFPVPGVDEALKSNVTAILSRMKIATPDQREDLLGDLSRLQNAAPYLASLLGAVNDESVEYVGRALGQMKDPESLPYICAQLESSREIVVIQAVKLMGDLEDANWVRNVRPLLGHAQPAVRSVAISTLMRLSDRDALPSILDLLSEPDRAVRSGAIVASINLARKFDEVDLVANQFRLALRNPSREATIDLLSAAGRLQQAALWDAVAPYLRDSDAEVRGAAVDALGSLGAKESVDSLLIQMQMETDKKVRLRMTKGAAAIRNSKFIDPLVEWLRNDDEDLVTAAHRSLMTITSKRFGPDHLAWSAWWEQSKGR